MTEKSSGVSPSPAPDEIVIEDREITCPPVLVELGPASQPMEGKPWPGWCQSCGSKLSPPNATWCRACGADDLDD